MIVVMVKIIFWRIFYFQHLITISVMDTLVRYFLHTILSCNGVNLLNNIGQGNTNQREDVTSCITILNHQCNQNTSSFGKITVSKIVYSSRRFLFKLSHLNRVRESGTDHQLGGLWGTPKYPERLHW